MGDKPIIFAQANPTPEIFPDEAYENGAFLYGSGRSDFPNQINNSLVFPGVFKGLKGNREIREVSDEMKLSASVALANSLEGEITRDYILPSSLSKNVPEVIASAMNRS